MAMNGKKILLQRKVGNDYVTFAATRSHDFAANVDLEEKSAPTDNDWLHYDVSRKSWQFTSNYLVGEVKDLLQVGTVYQLKVINSDNANDYLTGEAVLTSCRITATLGNLTQGSFVFVGNGALQ